MPQVGIRELRDRVSEIMCQEREENEQFIITYQGRPMALLIPLDQQFLEAQIQADGQRVLRETSLTKQFSGLVERVLSDAELEELYFEAIANG